MREVKIGLFGLGNIGTGLYKILKENARYYEEHDGLRFTIGGILVLDKNIDCVAPKSELTESTDDILNDDSIEIIIEAMGGTKPAADFLLRALSAGKTVITANKEVVAHHWNELTAAAKKTGAGLYFEASVCGGIPIIRAMNESLRSNRIQEVMGILNGTTNYILSRMSNEGLAYADALAMAQKLGFAEPNPKADVTGTDAQCKLSILSTISFNQHVPMSSVYCEGITGITAEDIKYARELGYVVKLLAIGKQNNGKIEVRVHPAFVPMSHPLAAVNGAYNAVYLRGNAVEDLMFYGKGAGAYPTGSSLVADLLAACRNNGVHPNLFYGFDALPEVAETEHNWHTEYYIRLNLMERPGVLAIIAGILGNHGISLHSVMQKQYDQETETTTVVFITHPSEESSIRTALKELEQSDAVNSVGNCIRVER